MPYALIHGVGAAEDIRVPLQAQGVNTENSFYTDGPSITAAYGFVNMLSELEGMPFHKKGKRRLGVDIKGIAFFIHYYDRSEGKVAFNSGTSNYIAIEDKLTNPPVPLETYTADMAFSMVIDYIGSLPADRAYLEQTLNARTRRFNGGTIMNDIMITDLNNGMLREHFQRHKASQVIDRSDLCITCWDDMLEYLSFYENPETKKRDVRRHSGVFYAHQTGYQLLEMPTKRQGSLLFGSGDKVCEHAYAEPIINLAELQHTTYLTELSDLKFWRWHNDQDARIIILTSNNL